MKAVYPISKQAMTFTCLQCKSFENSHGGKRRNCSSRAISSFSHSVSYPFGDLYAVFIKFEIVVYKLFEF